MSARRSLMSGSIWSVSANFIRQVLMFGVMAVLARFLGPHDLGTVALAAVVIDFARASLLSGFADAVLRQKEWDNGLAETVFWTNLIIGCLFSILISGIGLFLYFYEHSFFGILLAVMSFGFPFDAVCGSFEVRLRHGLQFRSIAARTVFSSFMGGLAALLFAVLGFGLWSLVALRLGSVIAQALFLIIAVRWRPRFYISLSKLSEIWHFSWNLMIASLLGQLNVKLTDFIIGLIAGVSALGLYQFGNLALTVLLQATIIPLQTVTLPIFSKLRDAKAIGIAYLRITEIASFVAMPAFLGAGAIAPKFIIVCFGSRWSDAAPIMSISALLILPNVINFFAIPALAAAGRGELVSRYQLSTTVSTVMTTIAFAPMGVVSVSIANVIRGYIILLFSLHILRKGLSLSISDLIEGLKLPFFCAATTGIIIFLLNRFVFYQLPAALDLLISIPLGAAIYVFLLLIIGMKRVRILLLEFDGILPVKISQIIRKI